VGDVALQWVAAAAHEAFTVGMGQGSAARNGRFQVGAGPAVVMPIVHVNDFAQTPPDSEDRADRIATGHFVVDRTCVFHPLATASQGGQVAETGLLFS
jgi:hypothetical protein